jgi:filamentous hemagglutinin family protein
MVMGDRGNIQRWQGLPVGLLGGWVAIGLSISPAAAQSLIVPDGTLGAENSQLPPNLQGPTINIIIGGARRGQNLFHSFQEFNVSQERSAYFFGRDANIQNILARITGTNPSNIDGRLGTFLVVGGQFVPSNANLFLINPNGIIFGTGASLDIGGSFVATTANAVQFPNGDLFSASAPTAPSQVLTVNPSALLYKAIAAQNVGIIHRSAVSNSGNLVSTTNGLNGLQVPNGRSLLLLTWQ